MELLMLETGIAVESSSNKADHQANGDLSTQMAFDRCFYMYGGSVIHSINFETLHFVGNSLSIVRHEVSEQAVVFGFVGAPWTIVAYSEQTAMFGVIVLKQPLLQLTEAISGYNEHVILDEFVLNAVVQRDAELMHPEENQSMVCFENQEYQDEEYGICVTIIETSALLLIYNLGR
ncbi:hypothetical protein Nepgr_027703 [Nepenthes gracilis]|uniref:Uncharacterized protein n=1 Tax=Nepenthes gracilis TaxID=150966 RepID=A0AAD3Y377_NEPGR|nr:hypothetical protein Nepgr_027703 [Nepenthes gracilis]